MSEKRKIEKGEESGGESLCINNRKKINAAQTDSFSSTKIVENSNFPEFGFYNCPHELLLIIFKHLNHKEICQMAR